jgi:hypothetical protein
MSKKIIKKIDIDVFIKVLFYLFPFFMLLESAFITSYVTIFTISTLFFFYLKKIKIKFDSIDYLIFLFFFLKFIATFLNINILGYFLFIKSILDFRFAIFFIVVRKLIFHKLINLKLLFIVALSCAIFLSLDIIFQHINGKDLFGNPPFDGRYNGSFEHEAIAGSYIQKKFLVSLSAVFLLITSNQNKFLLLFLINIILGLGIILSLDRMPFLIYLFIIFLLIIFLKNYRKFFILNFIFISVIFIFLFNNYKILNDRYSPLFGEFNLYLSKFKEVLIFKTAKISQDNEIKIKNEPYLIGDYNKIYETAYYLWLKNPFIGSGTKSFAIMCKELQISENKNKCSTHPHNIYLEIIITQGILGLLVFIILFAVILLDFKKRFFLKNKYKNIINILFLILLISELWPLRSYGSIFQTVNGSVFWFILALTSSHNFKIK